MKQSVHLRSQPDGGYQTRDVGLTARGGAIQAEHAAVRVGLVARAERGLALGRVQPSGNRPRARAALARQVGVARAAQAAAGHQQRKRLQQVGLAAAIRPVQHADPRSRPPCQRGVAAKVSDREADKTKHDRKMVPSSPAVKASLRSMSAPPVSCLIEVLKGEPYLVGSCGLEMHTATI